MSQEQEFINPFETLRLISAELLNFTEDTDPAEYLETVEKAAYMIVYIAEGLEREFNNATGRKMDEIRKIKVSDL